jgi:hypothetical protein
MPLFESSLILHKNLKLPKLSTDGDVLFGDLISITGCGKEENGCRYWRNTGLSYGIRNEEGFVILRMPIFCHA